MGRALGAIPKMALRYAACGRGLNGSRAFFHALADGLVCLEHKRLASSEMSPESRKLAGQMLTAPLSKLKTASLPDSTGADLRKFLLQTLERHIEKKLVTRSMLERIG